MEDELHPSLSRRLLSESGKCGMSVSRDMLCFLFTREAIESGDSLQVLRKIGEAWQFASALGTSVTDGIETASIDDRIAIYGDNKPAREEPSAFLRLLREAVEDMTLRILVAAALVSLLVGLLQTGRVWLEAVAILVAVVAVVLVTAVNDYWKEKQFHRLSVLDEVSFPVVRDGEERAMPSSALVVGDLVRVKLGMVVPAHGVMVSGLLLTVEDPGETTIVQKMPYSHLSTGAGPFLLSGSKVLDGSGAMLVCAVGSSDCERETPTETELQRKLATIARTVGKAGSAVALCVLVALLVHVACGGQQDSLQRGLDSFIVALTLVIVAVPEGLPLAVTLSLAHSLARMRKEQNLVRRLQACETMGGVTDVCTQQTTTLTTNSMQVVAAHVLGESLRESSGDFTIDDQTLRDLLACSFCLNSDAQLGGVSGKEDRDSGDPTECALLSLARKWGYDCSALRQAHKVAFRTPFNSTRKWMATTVQNNGQYIIYLKGAAERIVRVCRYVYTRTGSRELTEDEKEFLERKVIGGFASSALHTIAVAVRSGAQTDLSVENLPTEATLLGIFGLFNPLRAEVASAVEAVKQAGVTVRMVTGDNVDTAMSVAKECGILPASFSRNSERRFVVMEGGEFEREVGKDPYKFTRVVSELRVLARAAPRHKLALVTGLRQMENRVVAVTGSDPSDVRALREADIGFAMGLSSTQVARDAADIILVNDSFAGVATALKWGRNIYDSVRKFIQFQLTVNLVILSMSVLGAVALGQVPLSPVQMLWVNLIMDTFAALALATEPADASLLKYAPYRKTDSLIDDDMKKTVVGTALYQVMCLSVVLFLGPRLFGVQPSWEVTQWSEEGHAHFTMFFNTLVLLQVFHEINCRKLKASELNVFAGFFENPLFLAVLTCTVVVQLLIVQFGG